MRRFISHRELARDSRFIRQETRPARVLATVPDDVDAVVAALEEMDEEIRRAAEGTAAEAFYAEYGPAYQVINQNAPMEAGDPNADLRLQQRFHGILVGELQALEGASRSVWDFPDAPWEFKMNMARQAWDEARHVQIYEKLLEYKGGYVGMFPESTFLFQVSCHDDPAYRVAGVNRGLEGLACDAFRNLMNFAQETEDEITYQAVDYVLADEITHVRFGSEWVKAFAGADRDYMQRVQDFRREVDTQFRLGGGGRRRLAVDDRLEAGFTMEEIDEIDKMGRGGPSLETLMAAARIVRDRHRARRAKGAEAAE